MAKPLTFAIIGLGARGMGAFGSYIWAHPDEMRITAVADNAPDKIQRAIAAY